MVTAEFAVALPAVVAVLLLILLGVNAVALKSQACHFAGQQARAFAVGESPPAAPANAVVVFHEDARTVTAKVTIPSGWVTAVGCQVTTRKEAWGER